MKNKIWILLLSCIMVLGLCAAFVGCDLANDVPHEIKYMVDGEVIYSQKVYSETEIEFPADPSRLDYDFDGWYLDQDKWQKPFTAQSLKEGYLNHDIIVYAKWAKHTHKVSDGKLTYEGGKFMFTGSCACGKSFDGNVNPVETVIERATCLAEGRSQYTYTLLGVEYSIIVVTPKGYHAINGVEATTLMDENGYYPDDVKGIIVDADHLASLSCTQTAPGHFVCSDCGDYLNITIVKSHKFDKWTMVQVGTGADEYYKLSSTCSRADCGAPTEVIAEERYLTHDVITQANCAKQGTKVVTYNNGKITVKCDAVIAKTAHIYNGKTLDEYDTTNGAYNYYDKQGNAVFINLFADQPTPECGTINKSHFACESGCHDNLVYIEVYKNHKFTNETVITAPTCTTGGKVRFDCADCDYFEERDVNPTGHSYTYTLTLMQDNDNDLTNDTFEYTGACQTCGDTLSTTTLTYDEVDHSVVRPTCTTTGKHMYFYGSGNNKAYLEITIPTSDEHILNGVVAKDVYAGKDGVTGDGYSYLYSINGIEVTVNSDYTCSAHSGKLYNGYYDCESCGEKVYVQVYVDHIGDRTTITEPTCGVPGKAEVDCEICGKTETAIAPTGRHTYDYTIVFTPEEGPDAPTKYELASVCTVCGHEDHRVEIEYADLKVDVKTYVSCQNDGVLTYTYDKDGIVATGERIYALKGEHSVNHKLISELMQKFTVNGEEVYCIPSNVAGIVLPIGTDYHVGDIVDGKFQCDSCGGGVTVKVMVVAEDK